MRQLQAFALVTGVLIQAAAIGSAQSAPIPSIPDTRPSTTVANIDLRTAFTWKDAPYTALTELLNGKRVVRILDARAREIWRTEVPRPAFTFAEIQSFEGATIAVRGSRDLLELQFVGTATSGEEARYRIVLREDSRSRLQTLWQGREAANEPGDRLRVQDLNNDNKDELVLFAHAPQVPFCGQAEAPLFPRVWDSATAQFRPVALRLPVPDHAQEARVVPEFPTARFPSDASLSAVSTNDDRMSGRSYGAAPRALSDDNAETTWRPAPSATIGAFISASIHPYAPLKGVAYRLAQGTSFPALRVLIQTSGGEAFVATLPANQREGFVVLPQSVATDCATMAILDYPRSAPPLAFDTLRFHTVLDDGPLADAVNERLLTPYIEAESAVERLRIAKLFDRDDAAFVALVDARLDEIPSTAQAPIVEALLRSEAGRRAMFQRLADGKLSGSSIAAVGRALNRNAEHADGLYETLAQSAQPETRVALIRVLSRSVSQKDALRLLPFVADCPPESRTDLAFGLGQAQFTDIDTLLMHLHGDAEDDLVLLRAVARIAGRDAGRHRPVVSPNAVEKLQRAMNHDNGTLARVAYRLAGTLGIEALRDTLYTAITDDPHGPIRLAALQGLAFYDKHYSDDAQNNGIVLEMLGDSDPSMRIAAANILRDRKVSETEINFVLDALRREIWADAQRSLVVALVRQGRTDIDQRLADALVQLGNVDLVRSALVSWQARQQLVDATSLLSLETLARGNDSVFIALVRTTARLDDPQAIAAMTRWQQAEDLDLRLRTTVIEAMGRQRHVAFVPTLADILANDGSVDARRAAARGLAWFEGNQAARSALLDARAHERNPQVLESVEHAIRSLDQARTTREVLQIEAPPATAEP